MVEALQQYDFGSDSEDAPMDPDIIIGISIVNINYDKARRASGSQEGEEDNKVEGNEYEDMPQVKTDAINTRKAFKGLGIEEQNIK